MTTIRVGRPAAPQDRVTVDVPGSKSIANRALVCGSLATGATRLSGLPAGDDTRLLLAALVRLGVRADVAGDAAELSGPIDMSHETIAVDAGHGGTTARFLCAVAALRPGRTVISGSARLLERPMGPLFRALRELGATVDEGGAAGVLATVSGGALEGGTISVAASASSQFTSALMMMGPLLREGVTIDLIGQQRSRSYIEMTADVMRRFGASVETGASRIVVRPGRYEAVSFPVEADYSSAAFPVVASVLTGWPLTVPGVPEKSIQGDSRLRHLTESLACDVRVERDGLHVDPRVGEGFPGLDLDLSDESDLVPPLVVGLLGAASPSSITGIGFIRTKESNRLEEYAQELAKCGVRVETMDDGLRIFPGAPTRSARLDPRNDHRLAMAFALLPLVRRAGEGPASMEIVRAETVSKSWPRYWSDMARFCHVESLPS